MWTHRRFSLPNVGEIAGSLLPLLPSVTTSSAADVPDHLAHQLHTIRATISHLTHLRSSSSSSTTVPPLELLLYARIAPIASACSDHPDILHLYMNFTPFAACPHEDTRTSSPSRSVLDLPLIELLNLARSTSAAPIRLCLDIGGGMGTLAGVLQVYAYYKTFPMPMATHKFGSVDPITAQETSDDGGHFVSSVCWRGRSNMVVTANSTGRIKVLRLV